MCRPRHSLLSGGGGMQGVRIAFCGPRGTGKTTLADYLVKLPGFTHCSLAAPIKRIIAEAPADSYDRHQYLLAWARELYPRAGMNVHAKFASGAARVLSTERDPGRRAQLIGTDVGRALDQEVWIRPGLMARCQFPDRMSDANGEFYRPSAWP